MRKHLGDQHGAELQARVDWAEAVSTSLPQEDNQ